MRPWRNLPGSRAVSCEGRERELSRGSAPAAVSPGACSDTEEPRRVSLSGPAAVIILEAGEGTRMKNQTPKVLNQVCGLSMLGHVLAASRELDPGRLIVVTGHGRDKVTAHLAEHAADAEIVVQDRRGGTGHAVRVVIEALGLIHGTVVVTYADGAFTGIVEETDATPEQRAITEINSGMYAFDGDLLADTVKRVPTDNAKGEEYLTDVVSILRGDGYPVATAACADPQEVLGVNDQAQLAWARRVLNERLLDDWMRAGVTIVDPATTWIDVGVTLEPGVYLGPSTQLEGNTAVAAGAKVGPGCMLRDTTVATGATVVNSVCESAVIGPGVTVGPFAHLSGGRTP